MGDENLPFDETNGYDLNLRHDPHWKGAPLGAFPPSPSVQLALLPALDSPLIR